jgi:hypothetical protein
MSKKSTPIPGLSFSWKRALGITKAKLFSDFVEKNTADALANSLDTMEIKVDTLIDNKWIFFDMLRNERHANLLISVEK